MGRHSIIRLSGITDPTVPALGKLYLKLGDYNSVFHFITDDFPIDQDVLIGNIFLWETKAKLSLKLENFHFLLLRQ